MSAVRRIHTNTRHVFWSSISVIITVGFEESLLSVPLVWNPMPFIGICDETRNSQRHKPLCYPALLCESLCKAHISSGYEPDDLREPITSVKSDSVSISEDFAVCAFRDIILPSFSVFFTEKKLRTLISVHSFSVFSILRWSSYGKNPVPAPLP